jgi:hypothetical protein
MFLVLFLLSCSLGWASSVSGCMNVVDFLYCILRVRQKHLGSSDLHLVLFNEECCRFASDNFNFRQLGRLVFYQEKSHARTHYGSVR